MAWEQRGNRKYYYRKKRIGGRVVSEYVGTGEGGAQACRLDVEVLKERSEAKSMEASADQLIRNNKHLIKAMLLEFGFHQHHGQWRRKHGWRRRFATAG